MHVSRHVDKSAKYDSQSASEGPSQRSSILKPEGSESARASMLQQLLHDLRDMKSMSEDDGPPKKSPSSTKEASGKHKVKKTPEESDVGQTRVSEKPSAEKPSRRKKKTEKKKSEDESVAVKAYSSDVAQGKIKTDATSGLESSQMKKRKHKERERSASPTRVQSLKVREGTHKPDAVRSASPMRAKRSEVEITPREQKKHKVTKTVSEDLGMVFHWKSRKPEMESSMEDTSRAKKSSPISRDIEKGASPKKDRKKGRKSTDEQIKTDQSGAKKESEMKMSGVAGLVTDTEVMPSEDVEERPPGKEGQEQESTMDSLGQKTEHSEVQLSSGLSNISSDGTVLGEIAKRRRKHDKKIRQDTTGINYDQVTSAFDEMLASTSDVIKEKKDVTVADIDAEVLDQGTDVDSVWRARDTASKDTLVAKMEDDKSLMHGDVGEQDTKLDASISRESVKTGAEDRKRQTKGLKKGASVSLMSVRETSQAEKLEPLDEKAVDEQPSVDQIQQMTKVTSEDAPIKKATSEDAPKSETEKRPVKEVQVAKSSGVKSTSPEKEARKPTRTEKTKKEPIGKGLKGSRPNTATDARDKDNRGATVRPTAAPPAQDLAKKKKHEKKPMESEQRDASVGRKKDLDLEKKASELPSKSQGTSPTKKVRIKKKVDAKKSDQGKEKEVKASAVSKRNKVGESVKKKKKHEKKQVDDPKEDKEQEKREESAIPKIQIPEHVPEEGDKSKQDENQDKESIGVAEKTDPEDSEETKVVTAEGRDARKLRREAHREKRRLSKSKEGGQVAGEETEIRTPEGRDAKKSRRHSHHGKRRASESKDGSQAAGEETKIGKDQDSAHESKDEGQVVAEAVAEKKEDHELKVTEDAEHVKGFDSGVSELPAGTADVSKKRLKKKRTNKSPEKVDDKTVADTSDLDRKPRDIEEPDAGHESGQTSSKTKRRKKRLEKSSAGASKEGKATDTDETHEADSMAKEMKKERRRHKRERQRSKSPVDSRKTPTKSSKAASNAADSRTPQEEDSLLPESSSSKFHIESAATENQSEVAVKKSPRKTKGEKTSPRPAREQISSVDSSVTSPRKSRDRGARIYKSLPKVGTEDQGKNLPMEPLMKRSSSTPKLGKQTSDLSPRKAAESKRSMGTIRSSSGTEQDNAARSEKKSSGVSSGLTVKSPLKALSSGGTIKESDEEGIE